ncbi:MAG TPA: hypothetical protein VF069_05330 [Streptosporangiaceae bacterium]
MAERDSGWVSGGLVGADDARLATGVLATPGTGPIQARTGLKPAAGAPGLVEATPTPSMSVTVRPFQASIQGTRTTDAGPYLVTLDQTKTITVPPAHPSNPRSDLIVAQQRDQQYGDETTAMEVRCVSGTPGAAPADPTVSADYAPLARISVQAGATQITKADLTDLRVFTSALGGVIPVRGPADRPANPYAGLYVHRLDTSRLEGFDGTRWQTLTRDDDTGWLQVPVAANWTAGTPELNQDGPDVRIRRVGNLVHMRGGVTRQNSPGTHGTLLLVVPSGLVPAFAHRWVAPTWKGTGAQFYELAVRVDGELQMYTDGTPAVPVGESILVNTTWLLG